VKNRKGAPTNRSAFDKRNKLLGAEDRVLRGLGDAEFHDAFGGNLDGFAGLGVAAEAGGAIAQHQLADAGQCEGVLRVLVGEFGNVIENFHRLLFGESRFFSNRGGELGF